MLILATLASLTLLPAFSAINLFLLSLTALGNVSNVLTPCARSVIPLTMPFASSADQVTSILRASAKHASKTAFHARLICQGASSARSPSCFTKGNAMNVQEAVNTARTQPNAKYAGLATS